MLKTYSDEFEDFGIESWNPNQEDASDADMWIEDWDNEDMNDDFTRQLRYAVNHYTKSVLVWFCSC
jgi:hypothetical protein